MPLTEIGQFHSMQIAALLRRLQGAIDPVDGFGSTLGDRGVIRQWGMQPGCSSGYVPTIGVGSADDRASGLGHVEALGNVCYGEGA